MSFAMVSPRCERPAGEQAALATEFLCLDVLPAQGRGVGRFEQPPTYLAHHLDRCTGRSVEAERAHVLAHALGCDEARLHVEHAHSAIAHLDREHAGNSMQRALAEGVAETPAALARGFGRVFE